MESLSSSEQVSDPKETEAFLMELGFPLPLIQKAMLLTNDREKIVELIIKFQEDEEIINTKPPGLTTPMNSINMEMGSQGAAQMNFDLSAFMIPEKRYKMVFIVRQDLKMGVGKIAAQVAHSVLGAYQRIIKSNNARWHDVLRNWEMAGQPKIVLKVNDFEELKKIEDTCREKGINTKSICDAGRTQVEPGTITVCAIGPDESELIDQVTSHLKLL